MTKRYGFKEPVFDPNAYHFGGGLIPDDVLQADSSWLGYLPDLEIQNVNGVETEDCTGFGMTNAVEMYLKRKFGLAVNYSDRALGIAAGTGEGGGNTPQVVCETIRKLGLIPESLLPFSPDIGSAEQFYTPSPLPTSLLEEGQKWLRAWDFKHEYVGQEGQEIDHAVLREALKHSPIGIAVYAWEKGENDLYIKAGPENHWVVLVGFDGDFPLIFDSYEEKGSELKKLAPDYQFRFAKRIYIAKKDGLVVVKKNTFIEWLKSWLNEILA